MQVSYRGREGERISAGRDSSGAVESDDVAGLGVDEDEVGDAFTLVSE
jgi:hypothetical protein